MHRFLETQLNLWGFSLKRDKDSEYTIFWIRPVEIILNYFMWITVSSEVMFYQSTKIMHLELEMFFEEHPIIFLIILVFI